MKEIFDRVSPLWGVCPFDMISDYLIDCRAKSRIPEGAESVVIFAFPYLLPGEMYEHSNISKYAVSEDYHNILAERLGRAVDELNKLYPDEKSAFFADNSPIPEVMTAELAGIGTKGRNTLLITEKYGSFVFLGEIITTADIPSSETNHRGCLDCGLCEKFCPTGALKNGRVNKEICLSHISQKKCELTAEEQMLIKESGCAWGCDICQNVCPMNRNAETGLDEFLNSAMPVVTADTPIEGRAFAWRGEKVIKRNLEINNSQEKI